MAVRSKCEDCGCWFDPATSKTNWRDKCVDCSRKFRKQYDHQRYLKNRQEVLERTRSRRKRCGREFAERTLSDIESERGVAYAESSEEFIGEIDVVD